MKRRFSRLCLIFIVITLAGVSCNAVGVDHYVRMGASGDGSGTNWENAFRNLPEKLIRGDTYYIAAGNYGSYTFDDPSTGSSYIYIQKATVQDHGTNEGWHDAYGEGQAVFTGLKWEDNVGYYIWEGVTGSGTSNHGFKIDRGNLGGTGIDIDPGANHIIIAHTEIENYGYSRGDGLDRSLTMIATGDDPAITDITIRYCWMHNVEGVHVYFYRVINCLIEHCWFTERYSADHFGVHGESFTVFGCTINANHIYRYNTFRNIEGTGCIVLQTGNNGGPQAGFEIYGNIFYNDDEHHLDGWVSDIQPDITDFDFTNGAICETERDPISNVSIYNNVFVDLESPYSGTGVNINYPGSYGITVRNNLWINSGDPSISVSGIQSHNTLTGNPDLFADYNNHDYRLISSTNSGYFLSPPYNVDLYGVQRGIDGNWDRGAFEYNSTSTTSIESPKGFRVKEK